MKTAAKLCFATDGRAYSVRPPTAEANVRPHQSSPWHSVWNQSPEVASCL